MEINTINPASFTGNLNAVIYDHNGNIVPQTELYNFSEYKVLTSPELLDLNINIDKTKPTGYKPQGQDKYKITLSKGPIEADETFFIKRFKQSASEADIRQGVYETLRKLFQKSVEAAKESKTSSENVALNVLDRNGNPIPQNKLEILKDCKKLSELYGLKILVKPSDNFTFAIKSKTPYMVYLSRPLDELKTVIKAEAPVLVDKGTSQTNLEREILEGIYSALINLTQKSAKAILEGKK